MRLRLILLPLVLAPAACTLRRTAREADAARAVPAPTFASPAPASSDAAVDRIALVHVADALIAELPADTATACVAIAVAPRAPRRPADQAFLSALAPSARRVVASDRCPPTYAPGMIQLVDSLGKPIPGLVRPKGYVDPYTLELLAPERRADTLVVRAKVWQGSGGRGYDCRVAPAGDRAARCEWVYDFVS